MNNEKTPDLMIYVPAAFGNGGTVVTSPTLQVMLGNSDGTFGKPINVAVVVNPTMTPIAVGDVNGDGIPDRYPGKPHSVAGEEVRRTIEVIAVA